MDLQSRSFCLTAVRNDKKELSHIYWCKNILWDQFRKELFWILLLLVLVTPSSCVLVSFIPCLYVDSSLCCVFLICSFVMFPVLLWSCSVSRVVVLSYFLTLCSLIVRCVSPVPCYLQPACVYQWLSLYHSLRFHFSWMLHPVFTTCVSVMPLLRIIPLVSLVLFGLTFSVLDLWISHLFVV